MGLNRRYRYLIVSIIAIICAITLFYIFSSNPPGNNSDNGGGALKWGRSSNLPCFNISPNSIFIYNPKILSDPDKFNLFQSIIPEIIDNITLDTVIFGRSGSKLYEEELLIIYKNIVNQSDFDQARLFKSDISYDLFKKIVYEISFLKRREINIGSQLINSHNVDSADTLLIPTFLFRSYYKQNRLFNLSGGLDTAQINLIKLKDHWIFSLNNKRYNLRLIQRFYLGLQNPVLKLDGCIPCGGIFTQEHKIMPNIDGYPATSELKYKYQIIKLLSDIPAINFNNLIILDIFEKDSCRHGDKVKSIVHNFLGIYKQERCLSNVDYIPINFENNYDTLLNIYEKYINKLTEGAIITENMYLYKELRKRGAREAFIKYCKGTDGACIPGKLLNALISYFYDQEPDVISNSYWISTDRGVLPNQYLDNPANIVGAATNQNKKLISDYKHERHSYVEPLMSLYKLGNGNIIVGATSVNDTIYGMRGIGVSTTDIGYCWYKDINNCIEYGELGTSFAAPLVAVKLMLAKGYWRKRHEKINPVESFHRVILSSDINNDYTGLYNSPGRLNLYKLLLSSNSFIETTSDSIFIVDEIDPNSIVNFKGGSSRFYDGLDNDLIRGFAIDDTNIFIYKPIYQYWRNIEFTGLFLRIRVNGKWETYNSIQEFAFRYRHLIITK